MIPDARYWDAIPVVPLIVVANFFLGIYTNLSIWYKLIDKTIIGAYISLLGAAITLLLNFLLIPSLSYYGSAIATLAAYGTMMIVSYQLGKNKYPIPYDFPKIFGYLGLTIVLSAVSFYVPYIRENYWIKTALVALLLAYTYQNEKITLQRILQKKSKS